MTRKKKSENSEVSLPPQNIDAEKSLLGALIVNNSAIADAVEALDEDSFYLKKHSLIFKAISNLYNIGKPVDVITLKEELDSKGMLEDAGGASYIAELASTVFVISNVSEYIKIIKDKNILRRLIEKCTDIANRCYEGKMEVDKILDLAESEIFHISQEKVESSHYKMIDLMKKNVETIQNMLNKRETVTGVPTGFYELDKLTAGFQKSDMIVLAARPSMGKTSFALNIVEHMAIEKNIPVAVFSLEMSAESLALRILSSTAKIPVSKIRTGYIGQKDFQTLVAVAGRLSNAPIYIDDTSGLSILALKAKARRLKTKYNIEFIVIDYLQLLTSSGGRYESRQHEISEYSRAIKALAKELNVPVLVLSQLNRSVESRQDHKPQLSDLRESGAIEQDADVVMLLMRPEVYDKNDRPGIAEVNVAKQRNGPTGTFELKFFGEYTRFENLAEKDDIDERIASEYIELENESEEYF